MKPAKGFKFLEHMGDAYIEAYGSSLEEAYANAAMAMFETMTDASKVEPKIKESVEVEGDDLKSLLYSWLENLLIRYGIMNRLYSKFVVERIETEDTHSRLRANIFGEDFDPLKHPSKTEVKAVTFHLMEIEHLKDKYRLRFLLDL